MARVDAIEGAILGAVVGDALGLPYEALSARRGARLFGRADRYHFIFGRGMMSDDGEHACMVAESLATAGHDVDRFRRSLAWRLRWWLLGAPAGVGLATLRSTIKLWLGFPPTRSGVFSAGNGPAMRSALLGISIDDPEELARFVEASTRITHTDPKALYGAMAVALAARSAMLHETAHEFRSRLSNALSDSAANELIVLIERAAASAGAGETTIAFAQSIGATHGVSGYIYQTVPVAIHAWLLNPGSFERAVIAAIACGGDTDTIAAITGAIVGSGLGTAGIPSIWRKRLLEWPRSPVWISRLSDSVEQMLETRRPVAPPSVGPLIIVRNAVFLMAVMVHITRRMLPPY